MCLNIQTRDVWTDGKRQATIIGGYGVESIQVRIKGVLREFRFHYFVRKFHPVKVKRYREWGVW